MPRFLVIDLAATNGMDMESLSGLPIVQNPGLARMARQVQDEQDSYQYAPIQADPRDDSALAASGPPTYGPEPRPRQGGQAGSGGSRQLPEWPYRVRPS